MTRGTLSEQELWANSPLRLAYPAEWNQLTTFKEARHEPSD
jgi:hypothetical protein